MKEKKIVKIPVIDLETGELIDMEIEQDCLDAMDAADAKADKNRQEARKREAEAEARYNR